MEYFGISFMIPNERGRHLGDILTPLDVEDYVWDIAYDEIHLFKDGEYTGEFLYDKNQMNGDELFHIATNNTYYMIFITLRGYSDQVSGNRYESYDEFLKTKSKLFLSVADCSYVMVCSKDPSLITRVYKYATNKRYDDVRYLSIDDLRNYNWV